MSIGEGQKIGNYRIIRRLGVGGMGTVYLAEHPLIGKRVALKVIHRELSSNKEVIARFFNEARAVNKIGNEHIVEIHDFGQSGEGEHFFIMEYLEGRTLAHELEKGAIGVQRGLHIAAQIANGLAAAHTCGTTPCHGGAMRKRLRRSDAERRRVVRKPVAAQLRFSDQSTTPRWPDANLTSQ